MNKNSDKVLCLQHFLPYRLFVIASRISSSLAKQYEKHFNISRPEWRVLAVLAEASGLSAAEVSDKTAMDKVAVSRAVSKLIAVRYIKRDFEENDKRRSKLYLTAKGKGTYQKIVPVAQAHEEKILQQFDKKEIELLKGILDKLDAIDLDG